MFYDYDMGPTDNPKTLPGLYEGFVEFTNDPAQMGRLKVRVPCIHGITKIKTKDLPWAMPCVPFGGGPGFGTIMIPPEGSTVYVSFKYGDPQYPIYMGMFYGIPGHDQVMLRNPDKNLPEGEVSMSGKDVWTAPPGPDAPREFLIQSNNRPERSVVFKTVKGASIDVNDRDEDERMAIHDRSGQAIVFESNISSEENTKKPGNAAARGLKSAYEGDSLPIDSTLTNEGSVNLVDIGGQSVTLFTKEGNSKITLISKETDVTTSSQKEADGENATVTLDLASGDKRVTIEIKNKSVTTAKITLDGNTGFLEIISPLLIKMNSQNILLNGNVTVDGNLTITKNTYTLNDKIG